MNNTELVESRVDYLTATCLNDSLHEGQDFDRALQLGYDLVETEHRRGNDKHPWQSQSFQGVRSGQVCVGRSERGLLFRLSGQLAADHWRDVYRDATNVSRVDCAATVRLTGNWRDLSRVHHDEALQYQKEHSPKLRVTRVDGGKHGCTLNVGSRSSNAYARIYDKSAESGLPEYDDCWRYELEAKKDYALLVAARLSADNDDGLCPAAIACGWLERRGVSTPWNPRVVLINMGPRASSDDQRRLSWYTSTVAPGVQSLIAKGKLNEVILALGLSGLVKSAHSPVESHSCY